jgi:hypothetical protein
VIAIVEQKIHPNLTMKFSDTGVRIFYAKIFELQ